MELHALSDHYEIRKLQDEDIPLILDVCLGNPQFYLYTEAEPEEENIRYDMQALPPGKQIQDKYYIGFFKEDRLYAIMDLIDGYPDEQTAFIGFFMMHAQYSAKGLGSELIREVCSALKKEGFAKIRLCINDGNPQSFHFWTKNGFVPLKKVQRDDGTVILAEKVL